MNFKKNKLYIENIEAENIARKFGTPSYCYSFNKLKKNIQNFKNNFKSINPLICFSVKSNSNLQILKEIKKFGIGADVVSKGELLIALKAGINPKKIVFSGIGKTFDEIKFAIEKNILLINAESESEIREIDRIAKLKKKIVKIGIRLNPNTDAKTLSQISTGKKENKFGVNDKTFFRLIQLFNNSKNINISCLSVHIGSQILSHKPYEKMLRVISRIIKKTNHNFEYIDLGGGIGISYHDKDKKFKYDRYSTAIKKFLKNHKTKIIFEPGRSIIGNTGILISKVIYIKKSEKKNFIILDSAMNDFMRPALYDATYKILPSIKKNKVSKIDYEFVGPICESTDKFINLKKFQELKEKEYVVVCDVGAYGMSLSSNYNVRPKPIELMIRGSKIKTIKKRQKHKDLI